MSSLLAFNEAARETVTCADNDNNSPFDVRVTDGHLSAVDMAFRTSPQDVCPNRAELLTPPEPWALSSQRPCSLRFIKCQKLRMQLYDVVCKWETILV